MNDWNLAVVTPPVWEPVSLEEAKQWCKTETDEDDTLLAGLITEARATAELMTWRTIPETVLRLTLDRFPCGPIELPTAPVQSLTSVIYIDANGDEQEFDHATLIVGEPARIYPAYGHSWPVARDFPGSVVVTYVAGWASVDDVFPQLKAGIRMTALAWFENRGDDPAVRAIPFAADSLFRQCRWGGYR